MATQPFIAEEELQTLVLEAGTEDHTGLYEVIWELNGKFPAVAEAAKIHMARRTLENCVSQGYVELYQTHWPPVEYKSVPADRVRRGIQPDSAWRLDPEGSGSAFLAYCTTESGQRELERLYQHRGAA